LVGASRVVGVDSDPGAIEISLRNATRSEVEIEWVHSDVGRYRDSFDTVLMNPPFGAQTHRADRPFLDVSMAVGHVIYTFLNVKSEDFVRRRFESSGARITDRLEYRFPIARLFPFHRDEVRAQAVLLYRVEVAKG
jgi:putative methylase